MFRIENVPIATLISIFLRFSSHVMKEKSNETESVCNIFELHKAN